MKKNSIANVKLSWVLSSNHLTAFTKTKYDIRSIEKTINWYFYLRVWLEDATYRALFLDFQLHKLQNEK